MKSCALAARAAAIDLGVGRVQPAVQDVLADGAAEQRRLLRDEPDLRRAGWPTVTLADVHAVDADRAPPSRPTGGG